MEVSKCYAFICLQQFGGLLPQCAVTMSPQHFDLHGTESLQVSLSHECMTMSGEKEVNIAICIWCHSGFASTRTSSFMWQFIVFTQFIFSLFNSSLVIALLLKNVSNILMCNKEVKAGAWHCSMCHAALWSIPGAGAPSVCECPIWMHRVGFRQNQFQLFAPSVCDQPKK